MKQKGTQNMMKTYLFCCTLLVFLSCKSSKDETMLQGNCFESDQLIFSSAISKCDQKNIINNVPLLMAFFNSDSIDIKHYFLDILANNQEVVCAPGPFSLSFDLKTPLEKWVIDNKPVYFVLEINDINWLEDTFCISKDDGIPLPSDIIKIKKDAKTALVMSLKTSLVPNTNYYINITSTDSTKKTWIQPLMLSAIVNE